MKYLSKQLLSVCIALAAFPVCAAEKYVLDKEHTSVLFFVSHLGFSEMVGKFTEYDGYFTFSEEKPEESTVDVTLRPVGIETSSKELDKHLQQDKWFNTAHYPEARFVSTSVKVTGEKTADVMGHLTLLGVTKPVTLKA